MLTTKDYHSIHILDDPSINNNNGNNNPNGSNNGSTNNNNNNPNNNNSSNTNTSSGSSPNNNGIPTSSIQSVLKKKTDMPDILIDYQKLAKEQLRKN